MIKFGTDGWRGLIARDFTFENVRIVAQAVADYMHKQKKKAPRIVVGYDRRFLSQEFGEEVASVLAANKIKVTFSKTDVPTPVVSFWCLHKKHDLGIMITASHNPCFFNGIKIKTKEGGAADKNITNAVEKLLGRVKPKVVGFDEGMKKKIIKVEELTSENIKFLKKFFNISKIKKLKLKILVDVMYGVGNTYIQKVINSQSIKIDYLNSEFNPSFGGIHPEPIAENLQSLMSKVKKEKYDFGIAIDGDGDRLAAINKNGEFIDAQVLLPLLVIHFIKNRKVKTGIGKTVVGSNLIDAVCVDLGVPYYETAVGFKYISNLFRKKLISLGGEEAGGIGFAGYVPERDATASALMLLEMMAYSKKSFDTLLIDLWKKYGRWYYRRTSFPVKSMSRSLDSIKIPKNLLGKKVIRINKSDGIKIITDSSWLMFRKSGTEPIVRVYAESKTKKDTDTLLAIGEKIIKSL